MDAIRDAVVAGEIRLLHTLLDSCATGHVSSSLDDEGTTLLHVAANCISADVVQVLLEHGANVDSQTNDGITALHVAAMWGRGEMISSLLEFGANSSVCDVEGMLPVDYARKEGHVNCVKFFEDYSASRDDKDSAASSLDVSVAEIFVSVFSDSSLNASQLKSSCSHLLSDALESASVLEVHDDPLASKECSFSLDENGKVSAEGISDYDSVLENLSSESDGELYITALNVSYASDTSAKSPTTTEMLQDLHINSASTCTHCIITPTNGATPHSPKLNVSASKASPHSSYSNCVSSSEMVAETIPEEIKKLSNSQLRLQLLALGEHPGPVTESTRGAYLTYLTKLRSGIQPSGNKGYKGYKYELSLVLNGTLPIPDLSSLERQVFKQYTHQHPAPPYRGVLSTTSVLPTIATKQIKKSPCPSPNYKKCNNYCRTKCRPTKHYFNYLLLDPKVLGEWKDDGSELEQFRMFVESIFYVGKGKDARSMQHLKDAKEGLKKNVKLSAKLSCIVQIWNDGNGVISVPVFHNNTEEESFSREACIIETIGLQNLTNIQRGRTYGEISEWTSSRRRLFGVHLLYIAFKTCKLSTPKPLHYADI